jgi:hypothetical protein
VFVGKFTFPAPKEAIQNPAPALLPADGQLAFGRLACAFCRAVFSTSGVILLLVYFTPVVALGGAQGPAGAAN